MSKGKIPYVLGWAAAIVGFVYKALTLTRAGMRIAVSTGITPRHFLEASLLLFVICIAEVAYTWAGQYKPEARAAGSKG